MVREVSRNFKHILNECIEAMLKGESPEQCLLRYPKQAEQLEPLLRMAMEMRQAAHTIEPRPEFKAKALYRARSEFAARQRKARERRITILGMPRWAALTIMSLLILAFAAGSVFAVSTNSVPGDLLYPAKRALEQIQMAFTFSDESKAELHAMFASRRIEEIQLIATTGDAASVEKLSSEFEDHMQKVGELATAIGEKDNDENLEQLKQTLVDNYLNDTSAVNIAEITAPDEAKDEIATAGQGLVEIYDNVLNSIESAAAGVNPTATPTATTNTTEPPTQP
jgi:hypothetical protein